MTIWHDKVFDAFRRTSESTLTIDGKEYSLRSVPEKLYAMNNFLHILRMCSPGERDERIQKVTASMNLTGNLTNENEMLSWQEIEEMSRNNISFGAHTMTHPILTRMPLKDAVNEINASKETIEKKINSSVRLFAYPNGSRSDFNDDIKHILKEAGFLCGVTTLWGNNSRNIDPFELRRICMWDSDMRIAALRLGWHRFYL
jgi:hypothetical protein